LCNNKLIFSSRYYPTSPEDIKNNTFTKCYPVKTVENDTRPIAITNSIHKIAESLLGQFVNEQFAPLLDTNQFGCTVRRSTTHALIKLIDEWFKASESSNNFIRILCLDFSKAFDFINHNVLVQTFPRLQLSSPHLGLVIGFLPDSEQFVFIGKQKSTVLKSNAGTRQETIAGPNDLKLLINDFLILIVLNMLMTSQYRQSQLIKMIVHCSQQLITHAHGLSTMAFILEK